VTVEDAISAIQASPPGPSIGAFFDFDGTLIDGYSAGALYTHRMKSLEIGLAEAVHTVRAALGGPLDEEQFLELVSVGVAGWAGRPVEQLDELGERLFRTDTAGRLHHDMWRIVKAHQAQGHTVVIATSATRFQVAPLARELGIESVLCTTLEEDGGLLTGRVSGRPLWGPGKLAAVSEFTRAQGLDPAQSFAYANGDEDVPFLAGLGRPTAVNPQPGLDAHARKLGWKVLTIGRSRTRFDPVPVLRTAAMYAALAGAGASGIALGVLSRSRRTGIDFATSSFAQVAGALGDVRIEVIGEEHLWSHRPAVFLINHQSALIDLLVTTTLLRGGFTAVAKKEAASVPVIGPLLKLADFAFIDRSDGSQARQALDQALERLRAGTSIAMSPEGTRSYTPQIGEFKKGGFHLAMQAGVPIVPIVIRNAGELMARSSRTTRSGTVQVKVLEPIPTAGWTKADLDATVIRLHQQFSETLEHWPGLPAALPAGRSATAELPR
jgi:putative phosphoserine phosphatase/1-acylglycerol-3-phosphate O-acyltransferase